MTLDIFKSVEEVKEFEKAIKQSAGAIWINIKEKDKEESFLNVNLKSGLSLYVALDKLIAHNRNNRTNYLLELFCQFPEDEQLFYKFSIEYKKQ